MTRSNYPSVGEAIVQYLEKRDVKVVFGIPGVHTVELYRGLARSGIRHVTARHEQGAGFMADAYSRVSGETGVAFIITGPGMTNIFTPMLQARADSVPMLVVSAVNEGKFLGQGLGHLHEMPDQYGTCALIANRSEHVAKADDLIQSLDAIYRDLRTKRPGPMHIQVPVDVIGDIFQAEIAAPTTVDQTLPNEADIARAAELLDGASRPLILAGGGARGAEAALTKIATKLNAPVVQTVNARGLMHGHSLRIPASPSLEPVRDMIRAADGILAIGTELGPTDYDAYRDDNAPALPNMVRIDICPEQLQRHPCDVALAGDAADVLEALIPDLAAHPHVADWGDARAEDTRKAARAALSDDYQHQIAMLEVMRDTLPGSIICGDSTQPIYAGNLYYGHDHATGWFNSSSGFGALGYAIPAAIGAALAAPDRPILCVTGDGGAQFTLPEMMVAVDEKLPITFIIWNNNGYHEIETSMADAGVDVVGCDPTPPNFQHLAAAYMMPYCKCANTTAALRAALEGWKEKDGPRLIEIVV